jgi:hypothetical protein
MAGNGVNCLAGAAGKTKRREVGKGGGVGAGKAGEEKS